MKVLTHAIAKKQLAYLSKNSTKRDIAKELKRLRRCLRAQVAYYGYRQRTDRQRGRWGRVVRKSQLGYHRRFEEMLAAKRENEAFSRQLRNMLHGRTHQNDGGEQ